MSTILLRHLILVFTHICYVFILILYIELHQKYGPHRHNHTKNAQTYTAHILRAHTHKLSRDLLLPSDPALFPRRDPRVSLPCSPVPCWQTAASSSTHQTSPHPNPYRPELTSSNPHRQTPLPKKKNKRARSVEKNDRNLTIAKTPPTNLTHFQFS